MKVDEEQISLVDRPIAFAMETRSPGPRDRFSGPAGSFRRPPGAHVAADGKTSFRVWAPHHEALILRIVAPIERDVPMRKDGDGYHGVTLDDAPAGTRYLFRVGENDRPDPASRLQPEGVHRASEVVDAGFAWTDCGWKGLALSDAVVYELHVGTFTPEGTFDAAIEQLDGLKELGVNVIELLPIAQFPGERNWGYDGVYVNAVQHSYGGPQGLKRLVDACHQRGMALFLDVVYNHLGPEGNYLREFAPYFTDRYKTPWGLALNFDGQDSDHVRWFFINSALQFIDEFRVDGLRVDAVHAIVDHSAEPFLQDLTSAVHERAAQLGRRVCLVAETDLNDPRVITPKESLGLGFDSQWCDDFHHSLHTLLTAERDGYYEGFGRVSNLATQLTTGYFFTGQYSTYRKRKYGLRPNTTDGSKFVVCAQNHDQVGNRLMGDRLAAIVSGPKLRLAAAAVVLSPFVPMLFMGEEYGETAPFQYFTSHSDQDLIEAVRKGRLEEFDDFEWHGEPPDPHAEETFQRSKLNRALRGKEEHEALWKLYAELFRLRRELPALRTLDLRQVETSFDDGRCLLFVRRGAEPERVLIAFNFGEESQSVALPYPGAWKPLLETPVKVEGTSITLPGLAFGVFGE